MLEWKQKGELVALVGLGDGLLEGEELVGAVEGPAVTLTGDAVGELTLGEIVGTADGTIGAIEGVADGTIGAVDGTADGTIGAVDGAGERTTGDNEGAVETFDAVQTGIDAPTFLVTRLWQRFKCQ